MISNALKCYGTMVLASFSSLLGVDALAQTRNQAERADQAETRGRQLDQQPSSRRALVRPLKVGQYAPTFTLSSPDGQKSFDLRDWRGKRPVILIFGSYT